MYTDSVIEPLSFTDRGHDFERRTTLRKDCRTPAPFFRRSRPAARRAGSGPNARMRQFDTFGQWLTVNGYLTAFAFRMLRSGKADLLHLNQYQLVDHLMSGPFTGAYLAADPVQRPSCWKCWRRRRPPIPRRFRAFQIAADKAMTRATSQCQFDARFRRGAGTTLSDPRVRRRRNAGRHPRSPRPLAANRRRPALRPGLLGLQALHEKQVPAGPGRGKHPSERRRQIGRK